MNLWYEILLTHQKSYFNKPYVQLRDSDDLDDSTCSQICSKNNIKMTMFSKKGSYQVIGK